MSSKFDKEESNESLYETSTIATIQLDETISNEPHVLAFVQYRKVCIAIDKSITIFKNETCEEILLHVNFDLLITCYCISNDGLILFVVLSNGVLHCLHLLNKGQIIFTKNITNNKDIILKIFLQNESSDYTDVYFVTRSGAIYRILKCDVKLLKTAALNDTGITLKSIEEQIQCTQLFNGFSHDEVTYVAMGTIGKEISIAMLCSNMLYMWPSEQYNNFNTLCYNYIKIKFFQRNLAMLCLCTDYMLNMVCPQTLLGLRVYNEPVSDFAIIENDDNSLCQILVLTRNNDDCTMCSLRVLSFPELEQKFKINVPILTYLVEIADLSNEKILFLEGASIMKNNTKYIDKIKIKTISESLPEHQLQCLLERNQFDAAEMFANKFNLSLESVYCTKASVLLSQLESWTRKDADCVKLDALFNVLDKIENMQYVVECCNKALIPDYKQMRKLHLYIRARVLGHATKKEDEQFSFLFSINHRLHKLETFHMIWGYQKSSEYYDDDTMKEWIRFSQANFMEEFKTHLSLGKMEAASLIWTRHFVDIAKCISVETVRDIFALLPENISPSDLWLWLSHFIPTLLSYIPDAMCEIILWGYTKIKSFEQLHHSAWPQIGIDFANRLMNLLKFGENYQSLCFSQEYLSQDSNLKQLFTLIQAMSDIQKLKVNYRLTISLDLYIGEPIEVSHILLDKIHVDLISEFVISFLKQYMLNNSLQHDYVFSSYIQKTITNFESGLFGEDAAWEERIVIIINLIENIETKLQQILAVLKRASVPWSSTMITLAEANSNSDHALANQIRMEYNCVPIKLILRQYRYERVGINDKLIRRIIKENHNEMVSHIQQITKNDPLLRREAFSFCTNYYLSRGNFDKVMEILNSLETDVLLYSCIQIVNHITASLTLKVVPKSIEYYIEMLGWVKLQLEEISKTCKTQSRYCSNIIVNIDEVRSRYLLRKEFQINISLGEYHIKKKEILQNYIRQLFNGNTDKNNSLSTMCKKVIKVADLLQFERLYAICLLLEWTKDVNIIKYFIRSDEGKLYVNADECKYVYKMCLLMLEYGIKDPDIAFIVQDLISFALCICSDDELQDILSLNIMVNLYQECFNRNTKDSLNLFYTKQEEVPRTNWKLYTIYKDPAIIVDESLLSLFTNVFSGQKLYITKSKSDTDATDIIIGKSAESYNQQILNQMRKLKVDHNDYCFVQIIKTLYFNFSIIANINLTVIKETESMCFGYIIMLLEKLISARTFDLQLGLACLFMLSESKASTWISVACKSFHSDYTRHLRISVLGYEYFRLMKLEPFIETYRSNKILHCWARRLSKYSISYEEVLTSDATTKREILQSIMNFNGDDIVSLFQKFCSDFGFQVQDCLLLYLETIIKTWNPKLNILNINGRKELHIHEDEVNELRKKCNAIADQILDKVALKNLITSVLSEVNFYYYEIFIILMDLINDENVLNRNYFCFLQNYTRTGQPTQLEHDKWMCRDGGHTFLPSISEWRLPFLPEVDLLKLITPELNLKTYDKWLEIAPIFKLQPHTICILAIKEEVTNWRNKHEIDKWSACPTNTSLINNIKKCVNRITGPNALYYGTAILYYVMNRAPPGADAVAAAEECYKYAQLSVQTSTPVEPGMMEKIKFKYLHLTSEHILRVNGLENKNYLSLIGNPHKLVRELYCDESIPQRYRCIINHKPDINSAVNSISQLFSINIVKLRMELLQEWLQPDVEYMKLNQSITNTFSVITNSESNSNSDDNLLRARYILEEGNLELLANYLINISFNDSNENYSPETRYRAFHVLRSIVDTNKLEDLTKRDYQTIRNYMKSLKYIGRLEFLGVCYSMNAFETCSKQDLVQILWKIQGNYSPQALVVIAQICIDFEIYEYSLWDKNLTRLAKLLMINELKKILLQVRNKNIINCNGYLLGWQVVISESFRKMDVNPTPEQLSNCIESLQLFYSCPVAHILNFNNVIEYSFQCRQPHLAVAFLPFLNDDDKKYVLNKIRDNFNVTKVLEDLNNLSSNGILCVPYCSRIIQNALLESNI